ncbi:MAG: RNA methyltransferase [Actinomycetales bacterium]|nr:RNA methyltransferase [Actinomycetales bacterium]
MADASPSPKDRFVTVYGRNPVLEALANDDLVLDKLLVAENASGPHVGEILAAARRRSVPVQRVSAERVKKIAGNGKQDQGVCADVVAPRMRALDQALADGLTGAVLVLDGVTTPANVGMILRTATAAGFAGIVVPRRGVASIDPLVVKASAGVAFAAPILKAWTALEAVTALRGAGFRIAGLDATSAQSLYAARLPRDTAYVLGGESAGLGAEVAALVDEWLAIPMAPGVESLNVSAAAAVLCFEVVRPGR